MGLIKKGASAIGKLITVIVLGVAFVAGLSGVVYMSLQGSEVRVPEIVGKNFADSERELESLGLKIKKRADRYSQEAPNTVLEQIPRPGDTVKTGQLILVVTSKPNAEGEEKPATIQKGNQTQDDSETIEELISDKPKKRDSNSNSNTGKKKGSSTRDVIKGSNTSSNSSTDGGGGGNQNNSNKDKSEPNPAGNKQGSPSASPKPTTPKNPGGGDTRDRRSPNN
ncbi:MAG: PASTA domain-containing protein [Acidobacteria bacterium]|nr:PASTA domain-containing protein [Acidobacteriota bacterium]MBK8811311.1 PASTA domain-containing protein [Acidobacteriota bacterium]